MASNELLREVRRESTKGSGQRTTVTATSEVIQIEGERRSQTTETRGEATTTTTSVRAAHTVESTRTLKRGAQVTLRIPIKPMDPIDPSSADLGANCSS